MSDIENLGSALSWKVRSAILIPRLSFVETVTRPPAERGLYVRARFYVRVSVWFLPRKLSQVPQKTAELLSSITEVLYKLMPVTRDGDLLVENAADVSLAGSVYTTVHTPFPSILPLPPLLACLDSNNTLVFPWYNWTARSARKIGQGWIPGYSSARTNAVRRRVCNWVSDNLITPWYYSSRAFRILFPHFHLDIISLIILSLQFIWGVKMKSDKGNKSRHITDWMHEQYVGNRISKKLSQHYIFNRWK